MIQDRSARPLKHCQRKHEAQISMKGRGEKENKGSESRNHVMC